eukprot:6777710-Prymnesium_polylepis.1
MAPSTRPESNKPKSPHAPLAPGLGNTVHRDQAADAARTRLLRVSTFRGRHFTTMNGECSHDNDRYAGSGHLMCGSFGWDCSNAASDFSKRAANATLVGL